MSLSSHSRHILPQSRSSSPEKDTRRRRPWRQRIQLFALRHQTLLLAILHFSGIFLLVAGGSILLVRRMVSSAAVGDTGYIAGSTNAAMTADPAPWPSFEPLSSFEPTEGAHMVTGVILNWKRFKNVKRIVDHLCSHSMFQEIVIWNNNPDMFLKHSVPSMTACCASYRLSVSTFVGFPGEHTETVP